MAYMDELEVGDKVSFNLGRDTKVHGTVEALVPNTIDPKATPDPSKDRVHVRHDNGNLSFVSPERLTLDQGE
jgi:hypothetical protein